MLSLRDAPSSVCTDSSAEGTELFPLWFAPHVASLPESSYRLSAGAQSYLSPSDTLNYFNVAHNTLLNISKGCSYDHLRQNLSLLVVESGVTGVHPSVVQHIATPRTRLSHKTHPARTFPAGALWGSWPELEPDMNHPAQGFTTEQRWWAGASEVPKQPFIRNDWSHWRGRTDVQHHLMCDMCVKTATIDKNQIFFSHFWLNSCAEIT